MDYMHMTIGNRRNKQTTFLGLKILTGSMDNIVKFGLFFKLLLAE